MPFSKPTIKKSSVYMYNIYMYKIYVQKHQTDQKQFHWKITYMQQENNLKKSYKNLN